MRPALGSVFEVELLATTLLAEGSGFTALYSWFAPMAASVVTAYFGLREVGKTKRGEQTTVSEAVSGAKGLVKTIKRMF